MENQTRQLLGARIRELREARGISLRRFAVSIGTDRTYLSEVERGMRSPTVDMAARVAHGLGLTLSELFEGLD